MAITKEDLRDFTHFANEKLENGGAATLSDLVHEWELHRASSEPIQADVETICKLATFFPEVPDEILKQRANDRRGGVTTEQLLRNAAAAAERAAQQ
jgi:hypothetical protein